ncbi:MAG TPA: hypothetical protein VJ760_02820, partial [Nitrospiraceae bacterium]|nr:hypothetical protein [Nitrospiraceae bacterium]
GRGFNSPALHQTKIARAGGSSGEASLLLTPPDKSFLAGFPSLNLLTGGFGDVRLLPAEHAKELVSRVFH